MVTEMTKYNFVLLSGDADDFLRTLQKVGVVDITRSQVPVDEESEAVSARVEQLQKALEVLKQIPTADGLESAASGRLNIALGTGFARDEQPT